MYFWQAIMMAFLFSLPASAASEREIMTSFELQKKKEVQHAQSSQE
ncbi:MAG: hypothetical protein JWM96_673, partial [Alphaproteobacteria bacterium]|nr:hypothetical protein [Alphaproteobacteria bacterium]